MMAGLPETNIRLRATLYYGTDAPMNDDSRPVYLKLRDLIAAGIIEGHYREGEMLPSVRAFAAEQGANPLTVAKAYSQFQADGLIDVQRGVGMFVTPGAAERLRETERRRFLDEEWPAIRLRMERLGLDPAALLHDV
jgi:GntR family transcriptional regulator